MRTQLAGILAEPLPWWFWGLAAGAGAWGVAEYSGAQKRKQEIATLAGLTVGALAGLTLQPKAGGVSGLAPLRRAVPPSPVAPPNPIRPGTVRRRSWQGR